MIRLARVYLPNKHATGPALIIFPPAEHVPFEQTPERWFIQPETLQLINQSHPTRAPNTGASLFFLSREKYICAPCDTFPPSRRCEMIHIFTSLSDMQLPTPSILHPLLRI